MKPEALTWVSFAGEEGCLGLVVLEGYLDPVAAARECHRRGINPGGEVLAIAFRRDDLRVPSIDFDRLAENVNRLIPFDEAAALFNVRRFGDWEDEQRRSSN